MNSSLDKWLKKSIYVHLLAAAVLACLITFIALKGIDVYTNHNQAVTVPNVIGLQMKDAVPFFEKNLLRYEVYDSVFTKKIAPGAIYELKPEANSKVKKNRIVYIVINAKTEETAVIPDLTDISYREAEGILHARGFTNIEVKYVSGEYKDLTIGVEYGGQMIQGGTKVPKSARIILVVNDGNKIPPMIEEDDENEPVVVIGGDESWF